MVRNRQRLAKISLAAAMFCLPLVGCQSVSTTPTFKKCSSIEKTEAQCQQELVERGVYCRGVLERVEYVTQSTYGAANTIQTLLRFRDSSSCLTDSHFDPSSVNGIVAGTPVSVIWKRLPVASVYCEDSPDEYRLGKGGCDYVQTIEIEKIAPVQQ
ncbi:MAG: hypothetical protein WCT10_05195 [Patescibacteria group bacterium]